MREPGLLSLSLSLSLPLVLAPRAPLLSFSPLGFAVTRARTNTLLTHEDGEERRERGREGKFSQGRQGDGQINMSEQMPILSRSAARVKG